MVRFKVSQSCDTKRSYKGGRTLKRTTILISVAIDPVGQLADKPTCGQSTRRLDNSRTGQIAELAKSCDPSHISHPTIANAHCSRPSVQVADTLQLHVHRRQA